MVNIIGESIISNNAPTFPVGFVYIQFPNKKTPAELFGGTWTEIRSGSIAIGTNVTAHPYVSMSVTSTAAGAHYHCGGVYACCYSSTAGSHTHTVTLSAGNSCCVQATGTTVKVWKKTA